MASDLRREIVLQITQRKKCPTCKQDNGREVILHTWITSLSDDEPVTENPKFKRAAAACRDAVAYVMREQSERSVR